MASRAYRRDNQGRFAGANGGSKVTYGKAGGFANASFRARVQANRGNAAPPKGGSTGSKARGSSRPSRSRRIGAQIKKVAGSPKTKGLVAAGAYVAASVAIANASGRVGATATAPRTGTMNFSHYTAPKIPAGRKAAAGRRVFAQPAGPLGSRGTKVNGAWRM
jgi:hypothetical protein